MIRKRIVDDLVKVRAVEEEDWLDLERLAVVEVTSEEAAHPVESALLPGEVGGAGWRAIDPGEQRIRLLFDDPQRVRRIRLLFVGKGEERTQEFTLRWSAKRGESLAEIVRQQWTFSPTGAVEEVEDYSVDLSGVRTLELRVIPDISGSEAHASLEQLRIA